MKDAKLKKLHALLGEIIAEKQSGSGPRIVAEYIDGQWQLVPLEIGGKEYNVDQAVKLLKSNGWVDPNTGQSWHHAYKSQDEAESAIRQRTARAERAADPSPPRADNYLIGQAPEPRHDRPIQSGTQSTGAAAAGARDELLGMSEGD